MNKNEESRIRKNGRTKVKYFNKVYVMATAAAKMLSHAHFGQPREVMGLLQGNISLIFRLISLVNGKWSVHDRRCDLSASRIILNKGHSR